MRHGSMVSEASDPTGPRGLLQYIQKRFSPQHNGPITPHAPFSRAASVQRHLKVLSRQVNDIQSAQAPFVSALNTERADLGLTGTWKKDKRQSDSMDSACDMVKLPWIYRKALLILDKLEVEDNEEHIKTTIKAGGLMDVVESYPWNGEEVLHKRRDKRKGQHIGRVVRSKEGPCIQIRWDNPFGGEGSDTFVLSKNGRVLMQDSEMTLRDSGNSCSYRFAGLMDRHVHVAAASCMGAKIS